MAPEVEVDQQGDSSCQDLANSVNFFDGRDIGVDDIDGLPDLSEVRQQERVVLSLFLLSPVDITGNRVCFEIEGCEALGTDNADRMLFGKPSDHARFVELGMAG
jgi:hypothetical protein